MINTNKGFIDLADMFQLQRELLLGYYIKKQGLPSLESPISDVKVQKTIKEFIDNFIEELVEVHQAYGKMLEGLVQIQSTIDFKALSHDFKMELADTIHFLLNIMIYSCITAESIGEYYAAMLDEKQLPAFAYVDPLQSGFAYAKYVNVGEGLVRDRMALSVYKLGSEGYDYPGNFVSMQMGNNLVGISWDIVSKLKSASHVMKNRPWVQQAYDVNYQEFFAKIMEAYLAIMGLYDYVGFTPTNIGLVYKEKNDINWQRIKDKR